jgi:hypothetical protein
MSFQIASKKTKLRGYIETSTVILFAFATAFFPRILDALGAPSVVNFLHFAAIPFTCSLAISKTKTRNQKQIFISKGILLGLFILIGVVIASALLNNAGLINAILSFLLFGEPFILLLAIISIPMSIDRIEWFRLWIMRFALVNLFFGLVQGPVLQLNLRNPDYVKGVFLGQGAGHVIGASVSLTFAAYFFMTARRPFWIRAGVVLASLIHLLSADAKQVLMVFLVSGLLLLLTKLKNVGELVKYSVSAILIIFVFVWCIQNVPAFDAFNTWMRPEIYGSDGEATRLKLSSLRIILDYETPLNWFLGLGPGHTVSRLGGWMLREYSDLLAPLGSTTHPASEAVWSAVGASWLGDQSSFFSPFFGWMGIWGDIGFVGLGVYLGLASLIWRYVCLDDLCRFFLLNVFVFGLIFSQMEEPGYMLFVAVILGLRWQEHQIKVIRLVTN